MTIGGEDGFSADVAAAIDTGEGTAVVSVAHEGGVWSPLPEGSALRDTFLVPQFEGTLEIGGDNKFSLSVWAKWAAPLPLLVDLVELRDVDNATLGPWLQVGLQQA